MNLTKITEEEYPEMKEVHQNSLQYAKGVYELIRIYELWIDEISNKKQRLSSTYFNINDHHDLILLFHGLMLGSTVKYTAEDITDFSVQLKRYETKEEFENTGMFLSQLIYRDRLKNSRKFPNKTYKLILSNLQKNLNLLGYANGSNLYILGNAGEKLGIGNNGTIFIEGDVKSELSAYQRVYIEGNLKSLEGSFNGNEGHIIISGTVQERNGEYDLRHRLKIDSSLVKQKKIEFLQT